MTPPLLPPIFKGRMRPLRLLALIATLLAFAAAQASAPASSSAGCIASYSYAGYDDAARAHGVAATIAPLAAPTVAWGHVAGWVGVGGMNLGPGRTTEWLQVGVIGWADERVSRLYYEVTYPHRKAQLVDLGKTVSAGESHRVAVLELERQPSWWRVWVDGEAGTRAIHLPGSHGRWYPQALSESWNGGTGACNGFAYKFSSVSVAHRAGGAWRPMQRGYTYRTRGLSLAGGAGAFVARASY